MRAAIAALQKSAEEKDLGDFMEKLAPGYRDQRGMDKKKLRGMLQFYFMRHGSIHAATKVKSIDILSEGVARASVFTAVAGTPVSLDALASFRGDALQVKIVFNKVDGKWLVKSTKWRRASVADISKPDEDDEDEE